ncbi:MAG TPA: zinc-binding dehydrogenase [Caulobacter sp.]|nr:zinc-binding dehydrogenase [Caulobacter sp.]
MAADWETGLQLRSLVTSGGELQLSLERVDTPAPGPGEVVVAVKASPINPSDLGLLIGPADLSTLKAGRNANGPTATAAIPQHLMRMMAARADESMPVGNEGCGVVVAAGDSPEAQALLGKTVACLGGAMYGQYRTLPLASVMPLPDDTAFADGASCFVNPLTALCFPETMKREGFTGLVHTAAASNLGQMLVKICLKDGIPLVNIVRNDEQAAILRGLGATHVVDSSKPSFLEDLTQAIVDTGAYLAFDAIGGGKLAGQILNCMEIAANKTAKVYSRYGSNQMKQVYVYGGLDTGPTELNRAFGMMWGLGGWLLTPFLMKIGPAETQRLRDRVIAELKNTFASHYTREISLAEALDPEVIRTYNRKATGEKYLIRP